MWPCGYCIANKGFFRYISDMEHKVVRRNAFKAIAAAISAATLGFFAFPASALLSDDNSLVEGAKLCTRYLPRHERQYGIPVHLLAAIASTESGRYHRALGLNLPWPWTINVEGRGYFFDTKQEAVDAVKKLQERGIQSIDVGCMQVNLHHHPYAFASLEQAFDPAYNVAYAAQFLKQNFQEEGSWRKATADYHSHTTFYGDPYAQLVYNAWGRIISKVADARAGRPILNVEASKNAIPHYHQSANAIDVISHSRRSRYHAPHMHEISVTHEASNENGIMIIRGETHADHVQEQAKLDDQFVTQPALPASMLQHKETASAAPSVIDKGAQIIKIHDGKVSNAKGQFEPQAHVIRVNSAAAQASGSKVADDTFVFNN
jgi:hypothetical protein